MDPLEPPEPETDTGARTLPQRGALVRSVVALLVSGAALAGTVLVAGLLQFLMLAAIPEAAPSGDPGPPMPPRLFLVRAVTTQIGLLAPTLLILWARPGRIRLGFSRRDVVPCLGTLAVVLGVNIAGASIMDLAGEPYAGLPVRPSEWVGRVALLGAVLIAAPVVEELCFREALLARVFASAPRPLALAATSLAFGVLHAAAGGPVLLATLSLIGLALGWLRERTGSLGAVIALHAANNAFALWVAVG